MENREAVSRQKTSLPQSHLIFPLLVFAFSSNTPLLFFQAAAFYQIGQAYFFRDTLPQTPDLCCLIDIYPFHSPTILVVFEDNLFIKYLILRKQRFYIY